MSDRFELTWRETGGLRWLQWQGAGVAAAFPTRDGGVSPAPYDSLNLGLSVDDEPANVFANRRRLCAALGLPLERVVVPGQVHGTRLAEVGEAEAGRGTLARGDVIADTDGLSTGVPRPGPGRELRRLRARGLRRRGAPRGRCWPRCTPAGAACWPASWARRPGRWRAAAA